MAPWKGITIHAGWIPQLLKDKPSKKYSSSKSPTGINVKGYNRNFVQQIENLSQERQAMLMDPTLRVATNLGVAARAKKISPTAAFMQFVMGNKQRDRTVHWRDLVDDATAYKNRSTGMSIRGQNIWYMLGKTGPKEMAQTLLDKQQSNTPFKFKKAEKWYTHTAAPQNPTKHANWAAEVLGLSSENIDKTISKERIEHIGDAAEELIMKGDTTADVPMKPTELKGGAHARDIVRTDIGELESTEKLQKKGHHGLPDNYMQLAFDGKTPTEEAWEDFMTNTVITRWNAFAQSVLESVRPDRGQTRVQAAVKAVRDVPASESAVHAVNAGLDMSQQELQKMRHEFSIGGIREMALNEFGAYWREGIPISDRSQGGSRTYASSDLQLDENLEFSLNSVAFVSGLSHSLALRDKIQAVRNAGAEYSNQQNHFAHVRMNNSDTARSVNGVTSQGFDRVTSSAKEKINVSFSVKKGEEWLQKVLEEIGKDIKNSTKNVGNKVHSALQKKTKDYNDIFWALPYISIEEGLYKG